MIAITQFLLLNLQNAHIALYILMILGGGDSCVQWDLNVIYVMTECC